MKKVVIILCAVVVVMGAFIPGNHFKSGIYGTIDPPEGAKKVRAASGADSASSVPIGGKFSIDAKPGTWKLVVEAVEPYKSAVVDNILVQEGQSADAGVITLSR